MSSTIQDMKSLIENIEKGQLSSKITRVAKKYNVDRVSPILVFLRDGKPVDNEMGGPVNI